jgi:hypothetical protein
MRMPTVAVAVELYTGASRVEIDIPYNSKDKGWKIDKMLCLEQAEPSPDFELALVLNDQQHAARVLASTVYAERENGSLAFGTITILPYQKAKFIARPRAAVKTKTSTRFNLEILEVQ